MIPRIQEHRVRAALLGTHEQTPRPVADLELPPLLHKAFAPTLSKLKPAAVLVPLLQRPHELTVLLTRRAAHLRNHKGQISFPGGRRDPEDASFAACALREAREEIGLDSAQAEVIGYLDDYPTGTGYRVTPVVAIVQPQAAYAIAPEEVDEVFEVPLAVFLEAERFERKSLSRDGLNLPFFEVNHGSYRIWGATAGMLWDFHRKIAAVNHP